MSLMSNSAPDERTATAGEGAPSPRARLGKLLAPVRGKLAIACTLQAVAAALSIVPLIAIVAFAHLLLGETPDGFPAPRVIIAITVVAVVMRSLCLMSAGGVTHLADLDFQLQLRRKIIDRLSNTPLGWFTARNAGAVKTALQDDVSTLHHLVGHAFTDMTAAIVAPVVFYCYLLWADWRLALVAAIPVAIGMTLYTVQFSRFRQAAKEYAGHMEAVNNAAIEYIQGVGVIKAFAPPGGSQSRFIARTDRFIDFFWDWVRKSMPLSALAEIALSPLFSIALVGATGVVMIQLGWMSALGLLPFLILAPGLTAPFLALSFAQNQMMLSEEAAARLTALLEAPSLPHAASPKTPMGHEIKYENVSFSYDGKTEVVSNINLTLEPGTITALVGPSGSGKSTLAQLLPRFWDPTAGKIMLGGVALNEIDLQRLYRSIGFVFQNVQLVGGTIADNIALGRPDAPVSAIENAARQAQVYDAIMALPRGFKSAIGEDARISGGEAQRISIARAILADAPILVLDEATAFADPQSEAALQEAISGLIAGKTVLVIAHRLYTIMGADQICVLDKGRIVQRGTHDVLLAEGGLYADLWRASAPDGHMEAAE